MIMKYSKRGKVVLLGIIGMLLFAGCTKKSDGPVADSGELSIYTAYGEDEVQFMFKEFEAETGIKVKSIRLSAGEIYARVQAEANNPQASVWYGTAVDTLSLAGQEGYLESYSPPNIDEIPENLRDPKNMWVPNTLAIIGFVSNDQWFTENKQPYPDSWNSLLDPVYQDQVVLAHPATSGMSYTWLSTVVQFMGEDAGFEYIKKLDKNIFQYSRSGAAPSRMVGLGESAVAFSFSSDARNTQANGYAVTITYPKEGTGYEVTGAAIIKNGPAKEANNARKFVDWVTSKEAQETFVREFSRLPVNSNAVLPEGMTKPSDIELIPLDNVWSTQNRNRLMNKFETEVRGKENLS
jgi:iron(III) transport system substrate-binding protein